MVSKKAYTVLKGYHKDCIFKIIKKTSITFLNRSSWKSSKDMFFEYFPHVKIWELPFTMNFDIYIFIWNESLVYKLPWFSIFVLHIQCFLDSLEFQLNQEYISPTLAILKVVFALNVIWGWQPLIHNDAKEKFAFGNIFGAFLLVTLSFSVVSII